MQITNIRRCRKKIFLILFDVSEVQTVNMILEGKMDHDDDDFPSAPASSLDTPPSKNKSSQQFALSIFRAECFAAIFGHCTIAHRMQFCVALQCLQLQINYPTKSRFSRYLKMIKKLHRARATHCFGNSELSEWKDIQSHVNCLMEFNRKGIRKNIIELARRNTNWFFPLTISICF